jgi:hypothetical protein
MLRLRMSRLFPSPQTGNALSARPNVSGTTARPVMLYMSDGIAIVRPDREKRVTDV